ncbi:MAG: beta-lactamase family protein [Chlorobia bacterium]|nr:beta-lactamase family protein [Fimbriimonadaceae bacterium]
MITLSLLSLAMLSKSEPMAQSNGFAPERLAVIPLRMKQSVQEGEIAGTVVLIQRHGKTVLLDLQGLANVEEKRPMAHDTIFQIMSMTKPITTIALMICVERGLVNLNDPVERYLPNLSKLQVKQPDGSLRLKKNRLTVRQLVTHTAGFSSIDPGGLDDIQKVKLTLMEYAEKLHEEPLIAEPGTQISYSGPGFAAAGRIVEIVSGKTLDVFMQTEMFGPLGMKDTSFFAPKEKYPRIASMYYSEHGSLRKLEENPFRIGAKYANPAGGLYSTASDMATLLGCLADGGKKGRFRLLSPAGVTAMTTLQTGGLLSDGSDNQGYGLGFAVVRNPSGTADLKSVGSYGHVGAYSTEFWTDPKSGIVAVFMSQSFSGGVRTTFNTLVNAAFVGP